MSRLRTLVVVLGDQLDLDAAAFDGFDPAQDAVWMAEVAEESTHVPSSKPRVAMFLAAMRHFAQALREAGRPLHYRRLDDPANRGSLAAELREALAALQPRRVLMTAPGDWRVWQALKAAARDVGHDSRSATTATSSAPCANSPPMRRAVVRCAWSSSTASSASATAC